MATIDPITGLPSSNVQTVYAGDKPAFQVPSTNTATPSSISPKMDYSNFTKPSVQGSLAYDVPVGDTTPVAQAQAGTNEQIMRDAQAQQATSGASKTQEMIDEYMRNYLGLGAKPGVDEQKAVDQQKLNEQYDISGATSKLKDLSSQIDALGIQTQAEKQAILASPIGGITSADLSGREQEITRKNDIKKLSLAAESLVLQGKLDSAKTAINNAIDLKYAPQEARYKKILELNTLNEKILGREATKMKELAEARIKDVAEKKEEEKKTADMVANAKAQGAPLSLITQIDEMVKNGAKGSEIATKLGQWGGKYWEIEKAKADAGKLKASIGTGNGAGAGTYVKGQNPTVDAWVSNIQNKKATLANVPANLKNAVSVALVGGADNLGKANKIKADMEEILGRLPKYKNVVIGANAQSFPVQSQRFGDTADAIADAERLSALLTTENIQLMKGLGSMSNIEFGNIEKIGSSLIGRDKEGNAYFKGTRANYNREVQRLFDDLGGLSKNEMSTGGKSNQSGSKWEQGDTQNKQSGLSGMSQYINPNSSFGTVDFILPTNQ